MIFLPAKYRQVLRRPDFFTLILTLFVGQMATAFLLLSLVSVVFFKTHSNFGVSGIVLSLALPAFFLMAFAGLLSDLVDRRKLMIGANFLLVLVVLVTLFLVKYVLLTIALSFVYFGVNSFFIPAASAASAQLVRRGQLLVANSIFIFTLYGGIVLGAFLAAIFNFFFGHLFTLIACEVLLVAAFLIPFRLPTLSPRKREFLSFFETTDDIVRSFVYVLRSRSIWFFFLVLALVQGIIAFGVTLTPGFFDDVVGLSVNRSPLFILPLVGLGMAVGAMTVHRPKIAESLMSSIGIGSIGLSAFVLGVLLRSGILAYGLVLILVGVFTMTCGIGIIVSMIASRTVLQKQVSHNYLGTVFGANTVVATLFASILSPMAAALEALLGYVNILIFGGLAFVGLSWAIAYIGRKWKF